MTLTAAERRTSSWVAVLFGMTVLLQRFAVPGLPTIALLIPVVVAWTAAAWARGVLVVDATRMACWLAVAASTGSLMFVQTRLVEGADISPKAWALMLVIWLPFIFHLRDRTASAYIATLRHITTIATLLAVASIAMVAIQLVGVPYHDWFAEIVPAPLQLTDFTTSYPIEFRSSLFKSNAFIGLEPSMVSSMLGVGVLAAVLSRARLWKVVVLTAGLVATVAGSGITIALIGIGAMLIGSRSRGLLIRYVPIVVAAGFIGWLSAPGKAAFERVGEFKSSTSSTQLRVFEPYRALIPEWSGHLNGMLFGFGPGSSQRVVNATSIEGVLVTTPLKIFFEYGMLGGLILAGFVLVCYWGGPSRAIAIAMLVSTWSLQAGLGSVIIMLPVLITVTLWSPRTGAPLESRGPDEGATAPRASRWLSGGSPKESVSAH